MDLVGISFLVIFGLIFLISLGSAAINNLLPVSEPLIALAIGALIGLAAFGPLGLSSSAISHTFIHGLAEVTLAIALMTTALQVPRGYLRRRWKSVAVLLGLGMPLMWATSSLIVYLVLGLPIWLAVLIAAGITPTDPVLASTIVAGRLAETNIAARIRHLIIVESGANDGLAYAFVLLPLNLFLHPPHQALVGWIVYSVLWEVGGAIVVGALIGLAAGWLANGSFALNATDHSSFLGLTLALALLTLGALKLLGTDAILGVFVAGLAFTETLGYRGHELERTEHVQEAVERFFDLPVFVVLGAVLPWDAWLRLGWGAVVLAVAVLLLRRLPVVALLSPWLGPAIRTKREAVFAGWFGPIGISALFYATLALPASPVAGAAASSAGITAVWPVTTLLIVTSIIAHGTSVTHLTMLFGRRMAAGPAHAKDARAHDDDSTDAQQDVVQEIAHHVQDELSQSVETRIRNILTQQLAPLRDLACEEQESERIRQARHALASRARTPELGGPGEYIEELAREIARDVAHGVAEQAAQQVSDQVANELGFGKDDSDASRAGDEHRA